MNINQESALQNRLETYLSVEYNSLESLANWCKTNGTPEGMAKAEQFKSELRHALENPGTVRPEIYERWTFGDELETQDAVQQRLQEIWNACFG